MNRTICILLLTFLCFAEAQAKTPWERYLDLPSAGNAKPIVKISYSKQDGSVSEDYDARDLEILKLQVMSGDAAAFQLVFRLRETSDGGLLEELDAMLGQAVRGHPMLFLEQLVRAELPLEVVKSILLASGEVYVDRFAAEIYDYEMRLKAIQAIKSNDPKLLKIQEECINILSSSIRKK